MTNDNYRPSSKHNLIQQILSNNSKYLEWKEAPKKIKPLKREFEREIKNYTETSEYPIFEDTEKQNKFDEYIKLTEMLKKQPPKMSKIGMRLSGDSGYKPIEIDVFEVNEESIIIKNKDGNKEAIDLGHIFSIVEIPYPDDE